MLHGSFKWGLSHVGHCGGNPTTRGSLLQGLNSILGQEHRLEIGICGAEGDEAEELLQVLFVFSRPRSCGDVMGAWLISIVSSLSSF